MNYKVIICWCDRLRFESLVNEAIADGWHPSGGIATCWDGVDNEILYTQAMVKLKKEIDDPANESGAGSNPDVGAN